MYDGANVTVSFAIILAARCRSCGVPSGAKVDTFRLILFFFRPYPFQKWPSAEGLD